MSALTPLDKPNRRTVEALLHSLLSYHEYDVSCPLHAIYREAEQATDALEKLLLDNPKLKALKRKEQAAYSAYYAKRNRVREEAKRVRDLYQARGLTKYVLSELNALVNKIHSKEKPK